MNLPRGRTKRSYYREAKAREKGKLQAQIEDAARVFTNKKHFKVWLKKFFEENAHRIPKFAAYVGMAIVIKRLIDTSEELRGKMETLRTPLKRAMSLKEAFELNPVIAQALGWRGTEPYEGWFPEWIDWLVAFSLAVIVVEHGGQIILGLGKAISGLTGLVGFLLG